MTTPAFRELLPDGTLRFHFHPGQTRAWDCEQRQVLVLAGSQGGKTEWGNVWLNREIERRGEGDYLVVTATYPLLNLKLLPAFLDLFQTTLRRGRWFESSKVFEYSGGKTRVIFGSATNPESIESATAKAAWLDEVGQRQFRREAYEGAMRRLTIHQGRMLLTTTPYVLGWFKSELYDWAVQGDPSIGLVQFSSVMNPAFPREEFERARATLPAWKFAMFHEGKFAKPAGLIYDCFDTATHAVPRFPIPESWPCYQGVDFGPVHTAGIWLAQDPASGILYAYREYQSETKGHAEDHARRFRELSGRENIRKRAGGSHTESGWRDAYTAAGWPLVEPVVSSVEVGIDRVYALVKQARLLVFDDLQATLDQLGTYSRELDANYQPTEVIQDKAEYHLLDALRYIACEFQPVSERKTGVYRPARF